MSQIVERFQVIDVDSHLLEPPDLWVSRLPASLGDAVPHVQWDEVRQEEGWYIGDRKVAAFGAFAAAGWPEFPPSRPRHYSDADPACYDARVRLERMTEYGIWAQVLYPNIALFRSADLLVGDRADRGLLLRLIQVYNDFQSEWSSIAPERLLPVTTLPFWDLEATLTEIERCHDMGHRGVVFSQEPSAFGLPHLTDPHWDPMWRHCEERNLPVNFHIASGDLTKAHEPGHPSAGEHALYAAKSVPLFLGDARTISHLICGGVCHRFPNLQFVSVESGVGWIPFALDVLDWQWKNAGVRLEHPEYDLLPSEYFRRQMYGCFWFEDRGVEYAIERLGTDHILYETDFPHPTSMSPGLGSAAVAPKDYLEQTWTGLPESTLSKILHDNAARLYGIGVTVA